MHLDNDRYPGDCMEEPGPAPAPRAIHQMTNAVINSANRLSGSIHIADAREIIITVQNRLPLVKLADGAYITFSNNETLRQFTDVFMKAVYEM